MKRDEGGWIYKTFRDYRDKVGVYMVVSLHTHTFTLHTHIHHYSLYTHTFTPNSLFTHTFTPIHSTHTHLHFTHTHSLNTCKHID